jgi:hypothetical protein
MAAALPISRLIVRRRNNEELQKGMPFRLRFKRRSTCEDLRRVKARTFLRETDAWETRNPNAAAAT